MPTESEATRQGPHAMRFGIMCNGLAFEQWQAQCIRSLLALDYLRPALLIVDGSYKREPMTWRNALSKVRKLRPNNALFQLYKKFLFRPAATCNVDLTGLLSQVPRISCNPMRKGRFSEYFREDDLQAIRGQDLDFILKFGFGIIRGEILTAPRYGVWSFHHDDEEKYRGVPPCFWEITVIDGKRFVFVGSAFKRALLHRLGRRRRS